MTPHTITPETAARINKALAVLAITAFAATGMAIFPSFAPDASAQNAAVAPAPRIVASADTACAGQHWPNFDQACLRSMNQTGVKQVRLISTDRL